MCTLLSSTLWTVGKLDVFAIVVYSSVWVGNRVYYTFYCFFVCTITIGDDVMYWVLQKMQGRAQSIKGR